MLLPDCCLTYVETSDIFLFPYYSFSFHFTHSLLTSFILVWHYSFSFDISHSLLTLRASAATRLLPHLRWDASSFSLSILPILFPFYSFSLDSTHSLLTLLLILFLCFSSSFDIKGERCYPTASSPTLRRQFSFSFHITHWLSILLILFWHHSVLIPIPRYAFFFYFTHSLLTLLILFWH